MWRKFEPAGSFTIENPRDSYVWGFGPKGELSEFECVSHADFDQCMYGLSIQEDGKFAEPIRKSTRIL